MSAMVRNEVTATHNDISMDDLHLRHFILCEYSTLGKTGKISAVDVFEYFAIHDESASVRFNLILGICFLQPARTYKFEMEISQAGAQIGYATNPMSVDKPYEVMNLQYADVVFQVRNQGPVRFDILVDGKLIGRQFVMVRREEE
ncbi:hypothetical protein [Alicyclobacillus sp. ALC3]|uniref:hypothetical protein n=1 Tax=Alicyclobacillus sp. ALC3 TaxID=2796143 RepID=UPI002378BB0E|nr:hypothetical protein [Alicyclobacillus sp. ALC3]WDL98164.1 hypothetical protein JC200_05535 [Alicyclobacillus sp. ALC3]